MRVTFDNDDASSTEDRNLLLDWVEVQETPASGGTCRDTGYEGEAMAWSGVTGTDGEIRTTPAPAHRYFWQNGYVSQNHPFIAQPMRIRVRAAGDLSLLAAETGEEAEAKGETPASTSEPARGTLRTRCSRSKPT